METILMLHRTQNSFKTMVNKLIITILLFNLLSIAHANVITSIRPLGFIAAAITNGVTDVKILLPDGTSPHDYYLKPSDLQKINAAALFIWVGADIEKFLEKPLKQLTTQKQIVLINNPAIKKLLLRDRNENISINNKKTHVIHHNEIYKHHSHGTYNMHIWLSLDIERIAANIIHHKLVGLYPKHKRQLDINLRKFEEKLTQTDKNIAKMLQTVIDKRYFVFHDAYSYFEKRYHLSSLGYFTINPILQPGAKKLHQIRTILSQKKAVCIFTEPQFRPAIIKTVIKGTDVQMGILDPLGNGIKLSKDSYVEFLTSLSNQFKNCLDKN